MKSLTCSLYLGLAILTGVTFARGQGTAFTYQGRLQNNGSPANGSYNLTFALFDTNSAGTAVAGPVTNTAVEVSNGLFTVMVDFGAGAFTGESNWVEAAVQTNGGSSFTTLTPRQQITPVPYTISSENSTVLAGGAAMGAAQGNTIDPRTTDGFVGGGNNNSIASNSPNAAILGGNNNSIQYNDLNSSIAGGDGNTIQHDSGWSYIGGGQNNQALSGWSVISGGSQNFIGAGYYFSTIGGGSGNTNSNDSTTIGGGFMNYAGGNGATVPGGLYNQAVADYSFAAGQQAKATNQGTFVWADSQNAPFTSTNDDSFNVRALGGVRFVTGGAGMTVDGQPVPFGTAIGAGASNSISANNSYDSFIGGGGNNQILNGNPYSTIAGGLQNTIETNATSTARATASLIYGGFLNQQYAGLSFDVTNGGNGYETSPNVTISGGGGSGATASAYIVNGIVASITMVSAGSNYNTTPTVTIDPPPAVNDYSSTIGGGYQNIIEVNDGGSTIAGGNANNINSDSFFSTISGGGNNLIYHSSSYSVVGGGNLNTIFPDGTDSTISGGDDNQVANGSASSTIGGGEHNQIQTQAGYSAIGGGANNSATAAYATVSGGLNNVAGDRAVVGGGENNAASGGFAAVPGGYFNFASGNFSLAAGEYADATNNNTFVWSDGSVPSGFYSTATNQFLIQALGGVGINMNNPNGASLYVQGNRTNGWQNSVGFLENTSTATNSAPALRVVVDGGNPTDGALSVSANINTSTPGIIAEFGNQSSFVVIITNDGTIYSKGLALTSDRNAKENFTPLDPVTILSKVTALPVTEWDYKDTPGVHHLGPVAQDFHAAFGLNGMDDKHISVVDEGGVALAAIQGLNEKVEDKSQEIEDLKAENADLKQRLTALETLVKKLAQNQQK